MKNVDFDHRKFLEKMLSERSDLIEKSEYKRLGIIDDTEKAIIDLDAKLDLYKKEFSYCGPIFQRKMITDMLKERYINADLKALNLKLFRHGIIGANYIYLYILIGFIITICMMNLICKGNIDYVACFIITALLSYVIAFINEVILKFKF